MSTIFALLALATQSLLLQTAPLQIGDAAPTLTLGEFVAGEPIDQLTKGTVYVIEFSGTTCVPCIQLMPHLSALQERFPEVVIISVFPEEATEVREFLRKRNLKVSYRVAVDVESQTWNHWSDAACQTSIPHAFIVDANSKIAWIGHAALIDAPLEKIVKGTFDASKDTQRLALEQGVVMAQRQARERANRARAEYDRLNQMVIGGEYKAALAGTLQAMQEYAGSNFEIELFRGLEVFVRIRLPDERNSALTACQQYAIQSQLSGDPMVMHRCAAALVNAAGPEAPCKDQDVLHLADAILNSETYVASLTKADFSGRVLRFWTSRTQAQLYFIAGNKQDAIKTIEDTVAELEKFEKDLPQEERRMITPTTRSEVADILSMYATEPAAR
jgi:thiol-disulfide isomerase/thioredoxin